MAKVHSAVITKANAVMPATIAVSRVTASHAGCRDTPVTSISSPSPGRATIRYQFRPGSSTVRGSLPVHDNSAIRATVSGGAGRASPSAKYAESTTFPS